MVEIDERVGLPQALAQFLARDDIAGALEKEEKDVERAAPDLERAALLAQFAGATVCLEQTKSVKNKRRVELGHRNRVAISRF